MWLLLFAYAAIIIVAIIGFAVGYMVAEMRCTKELEEVLEERAEE